MKPFADYNEAEQMAIVTAAATSWNVAAGKERNRLWAAFRTINPRVDTGDGHRSLMPKRQAVMIRELVKTKLDLSDSLDDLKLMQLPLEAQHLVTTEEDYRQMLPMEISRAEAKILYALLLARNHADEERHGQTLQMHDVLLAKFYYYLTDNS